MDNNNLNNRKSCNSKKSSNQQTTGNQHSSSSILSSIEVPDKIRESIMKNTILFEDLQQATTEKQDEIDLDNGILDHDRQETEFKERFKTVNKNSSSNKSNKPVAVKNSVVVASITKLPEISSEFYSGGEELQDDDLELDTSSCQSNDKKIRIRSVISEDVLTVLRFHFQNNPKPNREEIIELSKKLNHPQRVLQGKIYF